MSQAIRCVCLSLLLVLAGSLPLRAQERAEDDMRRLDGFSLGSLTIAGTYFSQSVPPDVTPFEDVFLGAGESISGSADVFWRRTRTKSLLKVESLSTYGNRVQQNKRTNWLQTASNSWNEVASGIASRAIGRWRLNASGDGSVLNFDEAMFSTSAASQVIGGASNFRNVAGAVLNPETGSAAGFQPDPTAVRFLFGRRVASAGAAGEVIYAPSRKALWGLSVGASTIRHLDDGTDVIGLDYLQATSKAAGAYMSYEWSRATTLGFQAKGSQSHSTFSNSDGVSGSFSWQRISRRHWFAAGTIGAGFTNGSSNYRSIIYSGGLGFSSRLHTIYGYYNRDISELYVPAIGPDSAFFSTMNISWYWRGLRSPWWSEATYTHYRDQPPAGVTAPTSWRALETIGRQLGRHFFLNAEYSIGKTGARRYLNLGKHYQLEENAARVSVSWSPRVLLAPR